MHLQEEEQKDMSYYLAREERHKDSKTGYMQERSVPDRGKQSSASATHKLIHPAERNCFLA